MFESIGKSAGFNWKWLLTCAVVAVALLAGLAWILRITRMPLRSHSGPLPAISPAQSELADRLATHVKFLSGTIGERNVERANSLRAALEYARTDFRRNAYAASEHPYSLQGHEVSNLEAILPGSGSENESVIVGAHYDSVSGTVGADDNGTGVAAVLELARMLQGSKLRKSVRFVLFVNEEPPYFQTDTMGSLVYARQLRRDNVAVSAMISLEMLGYYSDSPASQKYPALLGMFYPGRGNFIGFVGESNSPDLVRRAVRRFRETTSFPSEGVAAPAEWPGVGWSDHWSFWQANYPAIMITDTALFRNPYYHTPRDTADKLDFEKMARVVEGVRGVVDALAAEQ